MRAIVIDRFGGPEELREAQVDRPQPGPEEVLIKVAYTGVNPADWKCREGWLASFFEYRFPFVLGFDMAGTIQAIGPGVEGLAVGDRVVAHSKQGAGEWGSYAEFALARADATVVLSDQVTLAEAAALPTAGIAAWEGIFDSGQLARGEKVLINGGAGGVGSYAVQLASHTAAEVAATCSRANVDYVHGLGAHRVIDYRNHSVQETVREWAPDGVDLVLDTVGQGTFLAAVDMVKPGGRIAAIATLVADEPSYDKAIAEERGIRIVPAMSTYERSGRQLRDLVSLLAEGILRAPHIDVLPIERAGEAHRRVQEGHVRGKIVLQVSQDAEG